MTRVRLGSVSYLNARPCVVGLERHPHFEIRFDVPSRCAALLHDGAVDVGLIPSIEYLRGQSPDGYRLVPGIGITSNGPVASVALYTRRPISEVRSIALDTSSRTSVALVRVLCAHAFKIDPALHDQGPDLSAMLAASDAALLIGDLALLTDGGDGLEKIDLGETWTRLTGLPFVYAFWAGWPGKLTGEDVTTLQTARDAGVAQSDLVAAEYADGDSQFQAVGVRYLRDNIRYYLGEAERTGLETFYRYAAELGLVRAAGPIRFY